MSTRHLESTGPAMRGRSLTGSAHILLAASVWGTTGTVQTLAPAGADPVSVGAARIVVGGAVLLALAALLGDGARLRRLASHRRSRWTLAFGAVCVGAYQTAFFAAVARTGVATGTIVTIGSSPVFAGLIAAFTGAARPTVRWGATTACAVTGCAALISGGRSAGAEPVGVALALVSGLAYASYATVAARLLARGESSRAVTGALFGAAAAVLLPVLLLSSPGWALTPSGALVAGYLGVVTTSGGYLLYARGLRATPVTVATTLTLAEPAVAALLGLLVLHERLGGVALAGLVTLVAGLLLLILGERRR